MPKIARTKPPTGAPERYLRLIDELATVLEHCLACDGRLSWSAEHDAQVVLAKAVALLPARRARHG